MSSFPQRCPVGTPTVSFDDPDPDPGLPTRRLFVVVWGFVDEYR